MRSIFSSFKQVFRNVRFMLIASIVSLTVFVLATWLPNLGLIWQITTSSTVSLQNKLNLMFSLVGSIQTNFTLFSASYTIAIALLFGINVAMVAYYLNRRKKIFEQSGTVMSFGGLASGIFGIGCAACGTLIITPILALIGAGGLVAALPFAGEEFGMLSVGILGLSVFLTSKKIQDPLVCEDKNINT